MKVKSIRRVQVESTPVFDIEVPMNHNFKLFNGPFVHNSKDISDALAGVVYGLSTRREVWSDHGIPISQAFSASLMKPGKSSVQPDEEASYIERHYHQGGGKPITL